MVLYRLVELTSLYSTPDRVDATMAAITEQRELANEISEAISNPMNSGIDLDEVWCDIPFIFTS